MNSIQPDFAALRDAIAAFDPSPRVEPNATISVEEAFLPAGHRGVRQASRSRLEELYEDYPWIRPALEALRRQFVPMEREQLFELWASELVVVKIRQDAAEGLRTPVKFLAGDE
ncbi:hypothetical protein [Paracoccus aminovorans]|uniref:hypothetical protein n=1 Tax=Paracoccus aminovorans TaxID=34004 RepID=UPI000C26C34B|nr:hypothetical protein [Paracoccus aminovorans]